MNYNRNRVLLSDPWAGVGEAFSSFFSVVGVSFYFREVRLVVHDLTETARMFFFLLSVHILAVCSTDFII